MNAQHAHDEHQQRGKIQNHHTSGRRPNLRRQVSDPLQASMTVSTPGTVACATLQLSKNKSPFRMALNLPDLSSETSIAHAHSLQGQWAKSYPPRSKATR
jgi:hypothetical protein